MSSVSGIRLFDYTGRYRTAQNNIDPDSRFQIPGTEFSSGYTVNGPTSGSDVNRLNRLNLGANQEGRLQQTSLQDLDRLMNFGRESYNSDTDQTVQGVTRANRDYFNRLEVSDQNYNDLVRSRDFNVFNGQLGINVKTDGTNITDVNLVPRSNDLQGGVPRNFELPDLADITRRAAERDGNDFQYFPQQLPQLPDAFSKLGQPQQFSLSAQQTQAIDPSNAQKQDNANFFQAQRVQETNRLQQTSEISNNPFRVLTPTAAREPNPIADRIRQFLPPDFDATRVSGADSEINPQTAKLLGTSRADLGVNLKESVTFTENLARLREGLAQQAHVQIAQRSAQARDGQMPLAPFVPSENGAVQQAAGGSGSQPTLNMEVGADAADKKSSGNNYMPLFRNSGGDAGGQGQQQQMYQRQPRRVAVMG